MAITPATKKSRIKTRAAEPSTWAGIGILAGVALPGLLTYLQTGSKTAGVIAILSGLAGGAATVMPEKGGVDGDPKTPQ
jgi:hypothetical protein